ncbi:ATP-binding protein [Burkholderia sp. JP2-270]|uniref:ATP-binding protein n=1 Tax=Burkholderia sp. JP2-270 TaxID=2217913 RepID=UPI0013A6D296|nr:ATP-binding protein [Burkholderia sp. JP2-270]
MPRGKIFGGRIAISGFDYQAIVILDQLFDHFDQHPGDARARPEGQDDLDLIWVENGLERRRHVQVKKPRTTDQGALKKQPWRLSEVTEELLPNTLDQLATATSQQAWILGDTVDSEVRRLVEAGSAAANREADLYWSTVHRMARAEIRDELSGTKRRSALKWSFKYPPNAANEARNLLIAAYSKILGAADVSAQVVRRYEEHVVRIDQQLPGVLARIEILDDYGSEAEVGQRFRDRLQREYGLPADVVEHNLFGNFRSFINDVAKRPEETIDRWGFEAQLRSAWPQMSAASEPPDVPAGGVLRPDLTDKLVKPGTATVIEVIGISGSGKTTLAAQAASALEDYDPRRLPIYVRVRADAAFRDVISGVSFHLLRRGIPELFGLAVESKPADETVIDRLAEICSGLPRPVQLLFDLVEGAASAQFGHDLGRFARALTPSSCRLVVFGQQSSFGALSPVETESAGILTINMRGFRWNEFVSLVGHHHVDADRQTLWQIFNRVTVGRPAGLYAQLAEALARQPSLQAMLAIASRPPEDMVSAAEQSRFNQLADGVRSAAERLVCFALPFRRSDAEAAFPNENVGAAIKALVSLGLLRMEAEGLLEMHETVRAGLESGIAPVVRQRAHDALARWYAGKGDTAARIFHLGKADRTAEADCLARETFLQGGAWRSLAGYVKRRALVTAEEIVAVAARPERISDFYLLGSILPERAPEGVDGLFMDMLADQRSRYFSDHDWARPVVEAILTLNPLRFYDLIVFTVSHGANAEERRQGLTWLLIAARDGRGAIAPEIVAFAKSQPDDIQCLLLPVLLRDGRRAALMLAFEIFSRSTGDERRRNAPWSGVKLKVDGREDVLEILAALPKESPSKMITTRSLGFGPIGSLIWTVRRQIRPFCVDLIKAKGGDTELKTAAWRVLIYIGHPAFEALVDPLAPEPIPLDYALLGPAFAPTAYDVGRYEALLFDPSAPLSSRQAALMVLLYLNVDFGALRNRLADLPEDPLASIWNSLFVMLFAKQPFAAGVPILKAELSSQSGTSSTPKLLLPSLIAVAEAPWEEVTDLLVQGIRHGDSSIRSASAAGLARRRSRFAAGALRCQYAVETDPKVVPHLAQALAACGPTSTNDLAREFVSPDVALWKCFIAMRTRDESFAPQLVKLATDTSVTWVVRRVAIWAAGRLPFAAALQKIAPIVLAEKTPLTIDLNDNLHAHASLSHMLQNGVSELLSGGEAKFVNLIASILAQQWADLIAAGGLPSPSEAARWLYFGLTSDPSHVGAQILLNKVQTPLLHAAVVRAFRLAGRMQDIDDVLASASSVWLAVKCLQERRWGRDNDPGLCPRLRAILASSPCGDAPILGRIVDEIEASRRLSGAVVSETPAPEQPAHGPQPPLAYSAAVRLLRGGSDFGIDTGQPIALSPLTREEAQRLLALADPANDPSTAVVRFTPTMTFTSEGHVVGRESSTSTGGESVSERLRPAIAAANRFDLPMPWHDERLRWPWTQTYASQFIASLGAQGDADRLYQALDADADILLPFLGSLSGLKATGPLLDDRLVPILHRYLSLGDDAFFESLCNLVNRISSPAAVPLLSGLLRRWASRLDIRSSDSLTGDNELWRGFARLREHPRFREIAGWRTILEMVLAANIWWFRKQEIVRILEGDPGSYATIEIRLAREENWVHFSRCEIDSLDAAAERLFQETR